MKAHPQDCYVLLMRHGSSQTTHTLDGACSTTLSERGRAEVTGVAHRLAETLTGLQRADPTRFGIRVHVVLHGASELATKTAQLVVDELTRCAGFKGGQVPTPVFDGQHASPYSGQHYDDEEQDAFDLLNCELGKARRANCNAVVVVAHQPLLGILARRLLTGRLPWLNRSVPLAGAEVACLAGPRGAPSGWRLRWTIAPTDEAAMQQLHAKIVAKMTVASVIGSVIAAGLVLLLDGLFSQTAPATVLPFALRYAAAGCLFVATWLYLATVYYCDRLLMPTRFWGEARKPADLEHRPKWLVWRPPGSATWVIYQNMLRIWRWFFVPATGLVGIGALLLGVALFKPSDLSHLVVWLLVLLAGAALLLTFSYWRRPQLGVED